MVRAVTRVDLAEVIFRKSALSRTESAQFLEIIFQEICNALARGESVKLSSFATFRVREKSERPGRNPRTGEDQRISARSVMTFTASDLMKAQIQEAFASRDARVAPRRDHPAEMKPRRF